MSEKRSLERRPMNKQQLITSWRRGWSALLAVLMVSVAIGLLRFVADLVLPDIPWLRLAVAVVLFVALGPLIAWAAIQAVFPGAEPQRPLRSVVVATFSDEASAHVAAAALEQRGIRAVVAGGGIGPQSGMPIPVGGMQVLVASRDRAEAEAALARAREHGKRG